MKRLWSLLAMMMVAMLSISVVSCGDDDDDNSPNTTSTETTNPNAPVWGEWDGSGTTLAGKHATMTLNLYSDGTGGLVASTSGVIVVKSIVNYSYVPPHHISMAFKDDPSHRIWLWVESLTTTTMQVDLTDLNEAVQGEYNLTKTGSGDRGTSGGSSSEGSNSSKCKYCLGSGKCHNYVNSSYNKYYCRGTGKCQWCGGDGYTDYGGFNNVLCSNCYGYKGSGKCSKCAGSGKCSECGGTGYQ